MARTDVSQEPWSPGGAIAALVIVAQVGWAYVQLGTAAPMPRAALFGAVVAGVAAMVFLARCRMPLAIKAALMVAQIAALLLLAAARDLSGLHTIATVTSGATGTPPARRSVAVVSAGSGQTAALAAVAINDRLAGAGGAVTVELTQTAADVVRWSVRRGGEERWCGHYHVADPAAPGAFTALGDRAAEALARSSGAVLSCD